MEQAQRADRAEFLVLEDQYGRCYRFTMTQHGRPSPRITGMRGGCSDGTCPAVHDIYDPALEAVQDSALCDPEAWADLGDIPAGEVVVVLPRSLLDSCARKRR